MEKAEKIGSAYIDETDKGLLKVFLASLGTGALAATGKVICNHMGADIDPKTIDALAMIGSMPLTLAALCVDKEIANAQTIEQYGIFGLLYLGVTTYFIHGGNKLATQAYQALDMLPK